jgi:RNA-directed DNA polymerase
MTKHLMEAICAPDNVAAAMRAVVRNKGAAGVDGMTIRDLPEVFAAHWPEIERNLLEGRYQPQPVRRVSIPKPDGGGERHLGIPTVFDRLIQQAVLHGCNRCGTRHSASTATAFDRVARLTKRWRRRKPSSSKAISSW